MGLIAWLQVVRDSQAAQAANMDFLALLDQGLSFANVGWWLVLMFIVAFLATAVTRPTRSGVRKIRAPSKSQAPDDVTKDYMEVHLERLDRGEPWGLVWHVQGYKAQRFLIAGLEPKSPAGRARLRAQGRGLRRGDELLSVNGKCQFQLMCQELASAQKLSLQFLKAEVVLPLESESEVEVSSSSSRSPSQNRTEEILCEKEATPESQSETELVSQSFTVEVSQTQMSSASGSGSASGSASRGRDAAIKRADGLSKERRKLRKGEAFHFSNSASGSGSGSEQASGASKCPSTDWEYMMDNRPGSLMHTELPSRIDARHLPQQPSNNVVIVAGSQAIALQTASAFGTVVGGGVFPMQVRGRQLPILPSSQMAAAPMIETCYEPGLDPPFPPVPEPARQTRRQASKDSSGSSEAPLRAGSAPPGGCSIEAPSPPPQAVSLRPKRTYRSGKKVRAKRTRAAIRAMATGELPQAKEPSTSTVPEPMPAVPEAKPRAARSGSAPPTAHRGVPNPEPEEARLFNKPRRRAGKKVRQRMEHAIARRREQALMAEAAESCRMVSDDEAPHVAPRPTGAAPSAARAAVTRSVMARAAKRADSPVSTVSTAISTAAATVSAAASSSTAGTSEGQGVMPRRSFYVRRPLPTMAEGAPETAKRRGDGFIVKGEMPSEVGQAVFRKAWQPSLRCGA